MEEEIWKPAIGYEGTYDVSNIGRVRSVRKSKILVQVISNNGYPRVRTMLVTGVARRELVHRMVALAFIGIPPEGHECAHLDGNRLNPSLSNLRWKTRKDNESDKWIHGTSMEGEKACGAKLNRGSVLYIDWLVYNGYGDLELGEMFSVNRNTIKHARRRRTWWIIPMLLPNEIKALNPGKDPRAFFDSLATELVPSACSSGTRTWMEQ